MKKALNFALLSSSLVNLNALASEPVVYGKDGRIEVYEAPASVQKLARSTALRVSLLDLQIDRANLAFSITQDTLKMSLESRVKSKTTEIMSLPTETKTEEESIFKILFVEEAIIADPKKEILVCAEERFQNQPTLGSCSGFLIAPDLLVTAGHCMKNVNDCKNNIWVFDLALDKDTQKAGTDVKGGSIYKCSEIVSQALDTNLDLDYAVIRLNRQVTGRKPLTIRTKGKIEDGAAIFTIGGPSGLPLKVATGATIRANELMFRFSANLDTYGGNSGSPVFNEKTELLEGILVEGEEDYRVDITRGCIQTNYCDDDKCMGENISRITSIPEVAFYDVFQAASKTGNINVIKTILGFKTWIDFNGKDGRSALLTAVAFEQEEVAQLLLDNKANPNKVDAMGRAPLHYVAKYLSVSSVPMLDMLLRAGAKIEMKNEEGQTPLLVAADNTNFEAVKILVQSGADINALDALGESALFKFAKAGDYFSYYKLIRLGAKMLIKNKQGMTAHYYFAHPE